MPREFKVVIIGAGMSGLLLGHLLELANIKYEIYERAQEAKVLGSAMGLSANIVTLFEQINLLEDFKKIAKIVTFSHYYDENQKLTNSIDARPLAKSLGYPYYMFTRPDLYELLLTRVPAHKIYRGKKLTSIEQDDDHVTAIFADGSKVDGDILVGADGGYSATRESLYSWLEDTGGELDKSDKEGLTFGYYNLVGTTKPMDPKKYPELAEPDAKIYQLARSSTPHVIHTFTIPGNRFAWNITYHAAAEHGTDINAASQKTDWGSKATQAMIDEVRNFKAPFGGIMGDYIDATPRDAVSRVLLEEKVFNTWYGGRVVLIGDSVHKMLPSAGQGAVNAMMDSVALANQLYDLPDHPSEKDIRAAFEAYRDERYAGAKAAFELSQKHAKISCGQTWMSRVMRWLVFNVLPESVHRKAMESANEYRPQCAYMPMIPNRGTFSVLPCKVSRRYQEELDAAARAQVV